MLGSGGVWPQVQDLHAVSPRSFLEVAGGVLHGLSYQQARNNTARVGQVRQHCMSVQYKMSRVQPWACRRPALHCTPRLLQWLRISIPRLYTCLNVYRYLYRRYHKYQIHCFCFVSCSPDFEGYGTGR